MSKDTADPNDFITNALLDREQRISQALQSALKLSKYLLKQLGGVVTVSDTELEELDAMWDLDVELDPESEGDTRVALRQKAQQEGIQFIDYQDTYMARHALQLKDPTHAN